MTRAARTAVYHITSTLKLPWIVLSGELRPYPNRLRGVGDLTYLWATSNPAGDKTAMAAIVAANRAAAWQDDLFRLVRFTLPINGFMTWSEVVRQHAFTADQVAEMESWDQEHYGQCSDMWRCRRDPLPLDQVLKVETRTYSGRWRPIDISPDSLVRTRDPACIGFRVGRRVHYSVRFDSWEALGVTMYGHRPLYLDSDEIAERRYAERQAAADEDEYELSEG